MIRTKVNLLSKPFRNAYGDLFYKMHGKLKERDLTSTDSLVKTAYLQSNDPYVTITLWYYVIILHGRLVVLNLCFMHCMIYARNGYGQVNRNKICFNFFYTYIQAHRSRSTE